MEDFVLLKKEIENNKNMPKRIRSMKRLVVEVNDDLYFIVKKITKSYNINQTNLLRWAITKMIKKLDEKIIEGEDHG